jgi:hypothetical protein
MYDVTFVFKFDLMINKNNTWRWVYACRRENLNLTKNSIYFMQYSNFQMSIKRLNFKEVS